MLTTPLQLAHATATLAMRGKRYQPHLVAAKENPITGERDLTVPVSLPGVTIENEFYWDSVIDAMHAVMQSETGTARAAGLGAPYSMAGKSGTAQVFSVAQEEEYNAEEVTERLRDHALFIAFAPLDDPQIAVAVVVENGSSGSRVAAPIARAVSWTSTWDSAAMRSSAREELFERRSLPLGDMARFLRAGSSRRAAARRPVADLRPRARRALQRGRREHRPVAPAMRAAGHRPRRPVHRGPGAAERHEALDSLGLRGRARVACDGPAARRRRPGRAALAGPRRPLPAVRDHETGGADGGGLVPARPPVAAAGEPVAGHRRAHRRCRRCSSRYNPTSAPRF